MKKLLVLLLSVFIFSAAFAGDDSEKDYGYSDVQSYDFDLSIETEGGQVEVEWDEFEEDNFKWYKFVYSQTDSNPSYPENKSQYFGDDVERDEADIWLDAGNYYVRLCAITHDNQRYCSEVKKLIVEGKQYNKYENDNDDKDEDEYEKKQAIKKAIIKKAVDKKTTTKERVANTGALSASMKNRVDTALERFIGRLEGKGYSDDKMVETLDTVIGRLEGFKLKQKYKALAGYMIEVLEEYREEYDDSFSNLEDVLNDF